MKINHNTITAIMCVKNESYYLPGFLKHIEPYVDHIIALDDGSTDNTVEILNSCSKTVEVIHSNYHQGMDWPERDNRLRLINRAYELGADWVLCCDPDERFELKFLRNLRKIISKERKCYSVHIRELWGNYKQYRCDGIWNNKKKDLLFPLSDNMTYDYESNHHIPWRYRELNDKLELLDYNLYHCKMIKEENRIKRRDLYNTLDPELKMQPIGYDYLTLTDNIQLKKIPFSKRYNYRTIPEDLLKFKEK